MVYLVIRDNPFEGCEVKAAFYHKEQAESYVRINYGNSVFVKIQEIRVI